MWQIAQRDYKFGKGRHKSLTKATYDAVGDRFRSLWGKEAGWAHSVLFTADLRAFSERLSTNIEVTVVKVEGADLRLDAGLAPGLVTSTKTEVKERKVKRECEAEEQDGSVSSRKISQVKRRKKS